MSISEPEPESPEMPSSSTAAATVTSTAAPAVYAFASAFANMIVPGLVRRTLRDGALVTPVTVDVSELVKSEIVMESPTEMPVISGTLTLVEPEGASSDNDVVVSGAVGRLGGTLYAKHSTWPSPSPDAEATTKFCS